jgi:Flp pilus assembly protein TadG
MNQHDEQGSVTLEAVLIFPALIFTIMTVIQVALFAHAAGLVDAAAREGARAARLSGVADVGRQRAAEFLDRHGHQVVLDQAVIADTHNGIAVVEVTGHATPILPGLSLPVHGYSAGPIEGFDAFSPTGVTP